MIDVKRRFLPMLLQTIQFEAVKTGQAVLKALQFLKELEGQSRPDMSKAPMELLNRAWQRLIVRPGRKAGSALLHLLRVREAQGRTHPP